MNEIVLAQIVQHRLDHGLPVREDTLLQGNQNMAVNGLRGNVAQKALIIHDVERILPHLSHRYRSIILINDKAGKDGCASYDASPPHGAPTPRSLAVREWDRLQRIPK